MFLITRIALNMLKFKLVDNNVPIVLSCYLSFGTDTVIFRKFFFITNCTAIIVRVI